MVRSLEEVEGSVGEGGGEGFVAVPGRVQRRNASVSSEEHAVAVCSEQRDDGAVVSRAGLAVLTKRLDRQRGYDAVKEVGSLAEKAAAPRIGHPGCGRAGRHLGE